MTTQQQKKVNPVWISLGITIALIVIGWRSAIAVNESQTDTLKYNFEKHCEKQEQKEIRTDEKLEKILQAITRLETKLDDPRRSRHE